MATMSFTNGMKRLVNSAHRYSTLHGDSAVRQYSIPTVVVIAGPTGVGKSDAAVRLASEISGEIVNADSVQVYRGMDIGSDKPTAEIRSKIRHHLIDIRNPTEVYSAMSFRNDALSAIKDISSRGLVPIVVGGSGFYLKWLLHEPPEIPRSDPTVRSRIKTSLMTDNDWLKSLKRLETIDPVYAKSISPHRYDRLARALEVYELTGRPLSSFPSENLPRTKEVAFRPFFLFRKRDELFRRVDVRCLQMLHRGLLQETVHLLKNEISLENPALKSIGYRATIQILAHYQKSHSSINPKSIRKWVLDFQRESRNYVRRQTTWFRKQPGYFWVDAGQQGAYSDMVQMTLGNDENFQFTQSRQWKSFQKDPITHGFQLSGKEQTELRGYIPDLGEFRDYSALQSLHDLLVESSQILWNLGVDLEQLSNIISTSNIQNK
eukprot:TRINITY_DN6361_c0_g1_i1.p1 TRINITY_DN6361_c0_g1~~TRINITY_DN6361_c0_g1_i1.p1  ORF type:complete len:434 (+),score=67.73 TRINITY_DN6361_c0_g1_i1:268-1569(+)